MSPRPGRGPGGPGGMPGGGKPKETSATIKRLLGYLGRDKGFVIAALVCVIVFSGATLAGSYLLSPIVDDLTNCANQVMKAAAGERADLIAAGTLRLLRGVLIMLVVYGVGVVANYAQQRIMIGVSQRALIRIRKDLFDHLKEMPVRYFDTNSTGDIMSRFTNDVDMIGELLNNTVIQLISGTISVIGTLAIMLYMNVWLALITVIMVPVMIKAAGSIAMRSSRYYRAQQSALGDLNGYIEEIVTGQKVVKVFCHEKDAVENFTELNDDLRGKQIKAQFFGGVMGPVMGNIGQVCYGLTATVGAIFVDLGKLTIGNLTVFVNYSRQFSRPINEISMQVNTIFSALAGAERVFTVMDAPAEEADMPDAVEMDDVKGEVTMEHVTFGYNPDKTILKDINLYAHAGQKVAFVGSTGAGKTTITNLLNRFYDIQNGEIRYDGIDITKIKKDDLRRSLGIVLQDTHLFTGTIKDNIRYGNLDATDEQIYNAAKLAHADQFINMLPHGYDTLLSGDGEELSQGQRQLISIARAAVADPPVLILDEATSSIDTRTESIVQKGMDNLMKGRTVFVIAHRLSTIRNSNAIIVLDHGQIIERGDHEDLIAQKGTYYQLYTGKLELS